MRNVIYFAFISIGVVFFLANEDGALPQNTGAPGDLTCGRAPCHNIPSNVGDALIDLDINNGQDNYSPGEEVIITISLSNTTAEIFGFQILALNENNQNAGEWILTEPANMKIIDGIANPSKKYVTHTEAGNQFNQWSLNWKAPDELEGDISFYVSVIEGNNNGMNTGDNLYNTSKTVNPEGTTATSQQFEEGSVKIFPNPVRSDLFIDLEEKNDCKATIYDLTGRPVHQIYLYQGSNFEDLSDLKSGVYFLRVAGAEETFTYKFVKQ